jgi:hypothetical protein
MKPSPFAIVAAALLAGCALVVTAGRSSAATTAPPATSPAPAAVPASGGAACADRPGPYVHCLTVLETPVRRAATAGAAPDGWGATDLVSAYRLPTTRKADALIAVSIAFDNPDLEQDLNVYRKQYGLAPCTTANGCFRKVNQDGGVSPLPRYDQGWGIEATLDVSMISAACPSCRILVVEGNTPGYADLAATEDTAVRIGADVVSNSYGGRETAESLSYAAHYDHPGHTIVVSSGDSGFTAGSFPAVFSTVTTVGGTTLAHAGNARGWTESAWPYAGSGCSAYVAKPVWQKDRHCGMRTVADVSAASEHIAVYATAAGGWITVGGTSASAPLVAGVYGLAGNATTVAPGYPYQHTDALNDVVTGANGPNGSSDKCGGDYLCAAGKGYDGPTGLGTPDGIGAF